MTKLWYEHFQYTILCVEGDNLQGYYSSGHLDTLEMMAQLPMVAANLYALVRNSSFGVVQQQLRHLVSIWKIFCWIYSAFVLLLNCSKK